MATPAEPIGLLIVAARQALRQAICARARHHRLTSQQFWALVSLRTWPGLTPGELAERMLLDAPAASRIVALLGRRRLVEVRPDRDDRRRTHVHLTAEGEALAGRVGEVADAFQSALVRGLSEAELAAVRAGLRRISENAAAFEAAGGDEPGAS